jgi:hypothetical protein
MSGPGAMVSNADATRNNAMSGIFFFVSSVLFVVRS